MKLQYQCLADFLETFFMKYCVLGTSHKSLGTGKLAVLHVTFLFVFIKNKKCCYSDIKPIYR